MATPGGHAPRELHGSNRAQPGQHRFAPPDRERRRDVHPPATRRTRAPGSAGARRRASPDRFPAARRAATSARPAGRDRFAASGPTARVRRRRGADAALRQPDDRVRWACRPGPACPDGRANIAASPGAHGGSGRGAINRRSAQTATSHCHRRSDPSRSAAVEPSWRSRDRHANRPRSRRTGCRAPRTSPVADPGPSGRNGRWPSRTAPTKPSADHSADRSTNGRGNRAASPSRFRRAGTRDRSEDAGPSGHSPTAGRRRDRPTLRWNPTREPRRNPGHSRRHSHNVRCRAPRSSRRASCSRRARGQQAREEAFSWRERCAREVE